MINTAALALSAAAAAVSPDGIERLPPSAFSQLPRAIVRYLERRGCMIPQTFAVPKQGPHNVIRGEFMQDGRRDWAVLCSRDRASAILLFGPGSPRPVAEIAWRPDHSSVEHGDDRPGYWRRIFSASKEELRGTQRVYGGDLPRTLSRDGLDEQIGKGAYRMYYRVGSYWWMLRGGDVPQVEEP